MIGLCTVCMELVHSPEEAARHMVEHGAVGIRLREGECVSWLPGHHLRCRERRC